MSPQPSPSYSGGSSPRNSLNYLYLYLPYLHFDTYANMIRRRAIIKRRMNHGRARPVPKDIADIESLELRVIWQYLGFDPPLNCRRTLDQFGYPSLQDTYSRDDDQMLYKLTKKEPAQRPAKGLPKLNGRASTNLSFRPRTHRLSTIMSEVMNKEDSSSESSSGSESELDVAEEVKDGNVLMVDQLWLWAIDTSKGSNSSQTRSVPKIFAEPLIDSDVGDILPQARVLSKRRHTVSAGRPSQLGL